MYYIGGVGPTITRLNAISSNYFSMIEGPMAVYSV